MEYQLCLCTSCQQRLEFPTEMAGQTINCPTCSQALVLPQLTAPPITAQRKSIFSGLINLIDDVKAKHAAIAHQRECLAALESKLCLVLQDGELEPHEVEQLIEALRFFGQSGFELPEDKGSELFLRIVSGIRWHAQTEALVSQLQEAFGLRGLSPEAARVIAQGRERVRVESGDFSPVFVPGLILKAGEQAYWSEPSSLLEDRVVRRRYEGGSRGVSVRVMKGVSFRVGASRGQSVSDVEAVSVSSGQLILTNQRFYFAGDRKNFSIPLRELAQIEFDYNTLTLSEERRDKPRTVRFNSSDRCALFQSVLTGLGRKVPTLEGAASHVGI